MFSCYFLECSDGKLYVGSCEDVTERFLKHLSGTGATYTRRFPPLSIAYIENFNSRSEAVQRELQLKRWSHAKKRALILKQPNTLHHLAK